MMGSVDVSIVLYNSDLEQFTWALTGLAKQSLVSRLHLVLNGAVDDRYADEIGRAVQDAGLADRTVVVDRRDNLGFTGGHNLAAQWFLSGPSTHFLVHNPDLQLLDDAIETLVATADAGTCAVVSPLLLLADPETLRPTGTIDNAGIRWTASSRHLNRLEGRPTSEAPSGVGPSGGNTGAATLFTRRAVTTLMTIDGELYDSAYLAYREDAELALRGAMLGVEALVNPSAVGLHCRQLRGTSRLVSQRINALGVQNRFNLLFRYGVTGRPGNAIAALARDAIVMGAVLVKERSSTVGLTRAWSTRRSERWKGRSVRSHLAKPDTNRRSTGSPGRT
jgi:GT2 family glycosyltransferase